MDLLNYRRRASRSVQVGGIGIGGENPIRLQSMTTTATTDTEGCVNQAIEIIEAGGELVRLTTQGQREAQNLMNINQELRSRGYMTPLVADVHFNPAAADVAALYAEKVRINPGNYVDPARTFKHLEYTPEEYQAELQRIRDRFVPFLNICKENNTAIRIGVNHGSLSDRIMSHYGNTPAGMVESCMEFLRICVEENFFNVVISIKASNTAVMVQTVRLLASTMEKEGMDFPLHLGVTEAGNGQDGRIKSAVGIGALLADGIGDTIRVSLSESPCKEIPVAKLLRDYIVQRAGHTPVFADIPEGFDYIYPTRRTTKAVANIGGSNPPVVISTLVTAAWETGNPESSEAMPDYYYVGSTIPEQRPAVPLIADFPAWVMAKDKTNLYPAFVGFGENYFPVDIDECPAPVKFLFVNYMAFDNDQAELLRRHPEIVVVSQSNNINSMAEHRAVAFSLMNLGIENPVVMFEVYQETDLNTLRIKSAADLGVLLLDGLADGIQILNMNSSVSHSDIEELSFGILQATHSRITRTEYISCPGCGRTLYNLEDTIERVKAATSHLKGLKIAIMGCIVNGPGEMADADYGYVGAGVGRISLYRGKECILKNIPESEATDRLLELINRDHTQQQ